jgi:hypothetical protein
VIKHTNFLGTDKVVIIHNIPFVFYVLFAFSFSALKSFVNAACILLIEFLQLEEEYDILDFLFQLCKKK